MHIHETKVRVTAPLLFYGICELHLAACFAERHLQCRSNLNQCLSLSGICNASPNCSEIFKFSIRAFAANTL
jgi:hypothetical protein